MKTIGLSLILLVVPIGPAVLTGILHPRSPWVSAAQSKDDYISISDALALPDVLWIDARNARAYGEDHIPGAMPLNEDDWDDQIDDVLMAWRPELTIVVYCDNQACQASRDVAERLRLDIGDPIIYILEGGWSSWSTRKVDR